MSSYLIVTSRLFPLSGVAFPLSEGQKSLNACF